MKWNYYNDSEPFICAWIAELIKAGVVPDGEIDGRSIELVQPEDVRGFRQCHFFAGVLGWVRALQLAGWDDEREVWTGSCPCTPFSIAGRQDGIQDKRHLWPAWFRLIRECRPDTIFGEQTPQAIGHGWLDLVCDDLEAEGYAVGPVVLPACSVGAFHIRQRLWFVADAQNHHGRPGERGEETGIWPDGERRRRPSSGGAVAQRDTGHADESSEIEQLGDTIGTGLERRQGVGGDDGEERSTAERAGGTVDGLGDAESQQARHDGQPRERAESFWADAEWLQCSDGKARATRSGLFPLAPRLPGRVDHLRAAGNSIVPQVAAEVIRAYMERGRNDR